MRLAFLILTIAIAACGGGNKNDYKVIDDLPFRKAENAKEYADLIIKAIRTNRDMPLFQEFENQEEVNRDSLGMFVGMYSTAISGRTDWEYIDVYNDSEDKDDSDGFDYAWLDPSGRLGLQIKVFPIGTDKGFRLERIELRSRLDVVNSMAFPGGPISDYEKLEYDWEAKMKRTLEEGQN